MEVKMITMMLVISLVACDQGSNVWPGKQPTVSGPTSSDSGVGGTSEDVPCTVRVNEFTPENGEEGVFYRTAVRAELSEEDIRSTITVVGEDLRALPGVTLIEGRYLTWIADMPLQPESRYIATVEHSCGSEEAMWYTSTTGYLLDTDVANVAYQFSMEGVTIVEPVDSGPTLEFLLGGFGLLLSFVEEPQAGAELVVGVMKENGRQDKQAPTHRFGVTWEDPFFTAADDDVCISVNGYAAQLDHFAISGAFTSDGERIEGVSAFVALDVRTIDQETIEAIFGQTQDTGFDATGGAESMCVLLSAIGLRCKSCDVDTAPYCVSLAVEDGIAIRAEDMVIEENLECGG